MENYVFRSPKSRRLFEFLKAAYVKDDEVLRVPLDKCGWRSLVQIAEGTGFAANTLYGKRPGHVGVELQDLITDDLIEMRYFGGESGRGREVKRFRIIHPKTPAPSENLQPQTSEPEIVESKVPKQVEVNHFSPLGRRLAAIMFTDMVGYTILGQKNEPLSLGLVEEQRKLIRPILGRHNGREVKTMGDSFLVVFASALDAVRCAYDIQRATREFNVSLREDRRIHLRVGIHLGDVVDSGGDILGDAVNVASRIESLAEDGGVCVTGQVFESVKNRFDLSLKSLGAKPLKNVSGLTEVYKMVMPWDQGKASESSRSELLDSHRVAVLPFVNISPDSRDEYFADGITDELISTISKIREIRVIARTSAMKFKGSDKGIGAIGRDLHVGTILEGTVRKADSKVRITAQLVDSRTEEYLWGESYNRELQDIFAVQSEIARQVAEALGVQLLSAEKKDIASKPTEIDEAHELYLKGRYHWNQRSVAGNEKAMTYFEAAIKLDPDFALAYVGLADCCLISADRASRSPNDAYPNAVKYAVRAIEIRPRLAEAHATRGWIYQTYEWKWREAEAEFKTALELGPSYATAHQWYALFLMFSGRLAEAATEIVRAGELDPLSRIIGINRAIILAVQGRPEEAAEQCKRVIEHDPNYAEAHVILGFLCLMNSMKDEAVAEARKAMETESDVFMKAESACILAFAGRHSEANGVLEELMLLSRKTYVSSVELAQILFCLDRIDEGFAYLSRTEKERSSRLMWFSVWPWFREIRKDSRWVRIERKMRLDLTGTKH